MFKSSSNVSCFLGSLIDLLIIKKYLISARYISNKQINISDIVRLQRLGLVGSGSVGGFRGVCRGGDIRPSLRVDRNSLVGNISDISVVVVGGVLDVLGPAVRKSNRVFSYNSTISISTLSSIEGSFGVVISNSIGVGVGFRGLLIRSRSRCISWSRGINWGWGICWGRGECRGRDNMDGGGSTNQTNQGRDNKSLKERIK